MSFSIVLTNALRIPLSLFVNNQIEVIAIGESVDIGDLRQGEFIQLDVREDIRVRQEFRGRTRDIPVQRTRIGLAFAAQGPGVYVVSRERENDRSSIRNIIEDIFKIPPFYDFPSRPCSGTNEIIRRIEEHIRCGDRYRLINEVVFAFVPNQGVTTVTLLEAAIIARNVPLVAYLLNAGANPDFSTAGVPLIRQLAPQARFDPRVAEIIRLLERGNRHDRHEEFRPFPEVGPGILLAEESQF